MKELAGVLRWVCVVAVALHGVTAVAADVDLTALAQETQKMSNRPDEMTMAWWIPEEFWAATLAQAPAMTPAETEQEAERKEPELRLAGPGLQAGEVKKITIQGVDFEFVWIPAGEFLMGSPKKEAGRSSFEGPQFKATIAKGFWLGKYEVTQRQWLAITGSNRSAHVGYGLDLPGDSISWTNCQDFIELLNRSSGMTFRLPNETEWEYACRAGSTEARYGPLDSVAWYEGNSGGKLHPVGEKQPNGWGLYDMLGNASEWCGGRSGPYPKEEESGPDDPGRRDIYFRADGSAISSVGPSRVFRGGSFRLDTSYARAAQRTWLPGSHKYIDTGLRLVLVHSAD